MTIYEEAASLRRRTAPKSATIVEGFLLCCLAFAAGGVVFFAMAGA